MADQDCEPAENWEEFDSSGELDKQLEQMSKRITILKKPEKSEPVQIVEEDTMRSSFQPQVKILKRQPPCTETTVVQNQSIGSRQQKSLAEREAAYAEARLRIFGSVKENDDDEQRSAPQLNEAIQTLNISETVIRQPKGPDGTPGFNVPRTSPR